ncbi:putative disease resistance RPP13-like protein 2 [Glycine max]|nr:putative disease resistance RPP13-like protein 2 [Glycine max]
MNSMLDINNRSRILATTRSKDAVDSCMNSTFDKAFRRHNNGRCPEDLMNISSDFVEKCKGLSLAIAAIGSLLSCKEMTPFVWGKTWKSLNHEVKSGRLIRQWITEGFVKAEEGKTLEKVVQQYLTELFGRSLVQVSSFIVDGKARHCHFHDLLREMILGKFKDLSFCQHINKEDESISSGMIRRLSIASYSNYLMGNTKSSHTRSLLVFADKESELTNEFVQRIPRKYRLLKVLDFEYCQLNSVAENWGNLGHLNFQTDLVVHSLPKLICKLQNLETLDIRLESCSMLLLPQEFCQLTKLRHLLGCFILMIPSISLGGKKSLQRLHHLYHFDCETIPKDVIVIRKLGKLKQLRNLSLLNVKEGLGSTLYVHQ